MRSFSPFSYSNRSGRLRNITMASADPVQNGYTEANGAGLSAAQMLMQKHDQAHNATIEDVPDEEDIKPHEHPVSSSVLESTTTEDTSAPGWVTPMSAKAAGKQKAQDSSRTASQALDTQSHELFPELGGAPKPKPATVVPSWGKKLAPTTAPAPNGQSNGTPTNGTSPISTPTSGAATPTSAMSQAASRGAPATMALPGRHQERISLAPNQMMPRNQLKKPLPDILKDINRKSKATVTMSTGQQGVIWFNAIGPQDAVRQALRDVVAQVGTKVGDYPHTLKCLLMLN